MIAISEVLILLNNHPSFDFEAMGASAKFEALVKEWAQLNLNVHVNSGAAVTFVETNGYIEEDGVTDILTSYAEGKNVLQVCWSSLR